MHFILSAKSFLLSLKGGVNSAPSRKHLIIAGYLSDFTIFNIDQFTAHTLQKLLNKNLAEAKSTNGGQIHPGSF